MTTVTLRNLGGSVVMVVPKKVLELVDLKAGSQVRVGVEKGRLVVDALPKPRYTLKQLLAHGKRSNLVHQRRDGEWLGGGPVGKEAI